MMQIAGDMSLRLFEEVTPLFVQQFEVSHP
jgi:hypothetical protein